jgi:hypothetical protein
MHRKRLLASLLSLTIAGAAPALAEASSGAKVRAGSTTLALDAGTAAALDSAGISVGPIRPASAGADGIAFPITGGRLATDPVGGRIAHSGGLLLRDADTKVRLRSFVIRLDDAPDLTAKVGGARVSILDLDLSQAQLALTRRRLSVSGVKATLSGAGAAALNQAFGLQLPAGLAIGTASVDARLGGHDGDSDSDSGDSDDSDSDSDD